MKSRGPGFAPHPGQPLLKYIFNSCPPFLNSGSSFWISSICFEGLSFKNKYFLTRNRKRFRSQRIRSFEIRRPVSRRRNPDRSSLGREDGLQGRHRNLGKLHRSLSLGGWVSTFFSPLSISWFLHRYLSKPRWGTKQNVWGKSLCILYGSCAERNVFYSWTLISNILLELWQICRGVCSVIVLLQMRKQQPVSSSKLDIKVIYVHYSMKEVQFFVVFFSKHT
jgi:hypothetical protein